MHKKMKAEIVKPDMILYSNIVYSNPFDNYLQRVLPLSIELIRPFYDLKKWEKRPLLVWMSGGAFRGVSPSRNIPELVEYAEKGYVVASISYRLTGDTLFPSPVQDVKTAIRYLKTHHERFGIDPERVVAAGHSAGAYLAAMAAATGDEPTFTTEEWSGVSSCVNGAVCMSGGDLFLEESGELDKKGSLVLELLLGDKFVSVPEKVRAASPSTYLDRNTPPFLLIHGEKDEMVSIDTNRGFYKRLIAAGVDADFYEIEGAGHGTAELRQPEVKRIIHDFCEKVFKI